MQKLLRKALCWVFIQVVGWAVWAGDVSASSYQEQFSTHMEAAQSHIAKKEWDGALGALSKLKTLLDSDSDSTSAIELAWYFDFQRFVLFESGRKEQAYKACELAVDELGDDVDEWQYLEEFNVVRRTLRACYNLLAWENMETAKTLDELHSAIQFIVDGLSIRGAGEDEDVLDPFLATEVIIYLEAMRYEIRYKAYAFNLLRTFDKRKNLPGADDERIVRALKSPEYLQHVFPVAPEDYSFSSVKNMPAAKPVPKSVHKQLLGFVTDCHRGKMLACDTLYEVSLDNSILEKYGNTCGGRLKNSNDEYCEDIESSLWLLKGKKPPTKLTPNAATACEKGDMAACDILYDGSPRSSDAEFYGESCGGRFELVLGGCEVLLEGDE